MNGEKCISKQKNARMGIYLALFLFALLALLAALHLLLHDDTRLPFDLVVFS